MRRIIATAVIAIALAGSYFAGAATQGDIMPANAASVSCSATLTNVIVTPEGKYFVRFSDGVEFEFNALEDLQQFALGVQTTDNAQRLLVAWWLARDDDANNVNIVKGKKLTFDVSVAAPIKVQ